MADKEQYAKWIVDNQSKRGTPEFETVANAYRAATESAPSQQAPKSPVDGMGAAQRFFAGVGAGMANTARGVGQAAGLVSEQDIQRSRERDAPLMNTFAGKAGSVVGSVASLLPTMLIPGANTLTGAALIGAGSGAAMPVAGDESRLGNAAIGGAAGLAGGALAKGISRVLAPKTSTEVMGLIDEGITPTPGQALGGTFRRVEEASKSIPFVGGGIRNAERRAMEDFNKTALNRALEPIGAKSTAIGNDGVIQARTLIGGAYDDALAMLKKVNVDTRFSNELTRIKNMGNTLPPNIKRQLNGIINDQLTNKLTPNKTVSGDSFKQIVSEFGRLGSGYKSGANGFDQQQLGDALLSVKDSLMGLAGRQNPAAKAALQKADKAYAQLLRVENAAARAQEGIFTPAQLAAASKAMDKSARKVATAQGGALMQDFAQAGRNVLGETLPNSGTADRAMNALMLGGGYMVDPIVAASMLTGRAAYTPLGQRAAVNLITQRPQMIRQLGEGVGQLAAPAALGGSAMLTGGQ